MKKYILRFLKEEEGAELIQFAIVVGIAALLAGAVLLVFQAAGDQMHRAAELVDDMEYATITPTWGGGGGGTGSPPP